MLRGFQDEMVRCLVECDVPGIRRLWRHVAPHTPQPGTDADTLVSIHLARTQNDTLNFRLRAYSHRWLTERSYPSLLPDELKPKAERLYPQIVDAVGIAVGGTGELGRAIAPIIRGAMSDAVMECYADKRTEPVFVKARMMEARKRTVAKLIGK